MSRPVDWKISSLWRHQAFRNLWAAQTVSQFGSQITLVALPLIAVLALDASAFEMGVLSAAYMLPFLLFGLIAGVWIDRLRRRPILIATDFLRAGILLVVPVAAILDILRIEILIGVQFAVGSMTLFFDVAYQSYLPDLVTREQLTEGNSKLEISRSTARISGPSVAGIVVGWLSGPIAIFLDAMTYLLSAGFLLRIRETDVKPPSPRAKESFRVEVAEGIGVVLRDPILRSTTLALHSGISRIV